MSLLSDLMFLDIRRAGIRLKIFAKIIVKFEKRVNTRNFFNDLASMQTRKEQNDEVLGIFSGFWNLKILKLKK